MNRRAKSNDAYTGVFISYVTCIYVIPHVRERESVMAARQISQQHKCVAVYYQD